MATVPSFRTWSSGETVTAAYLNANIRDAGNYWVTNRPRAKLRATAVQSIPDNAATPVNFDTEDMDNDSGHSTVTNTSRYTAQTQGWFMCSGSVAHGASTAGTSRSADIAVNGTVVVGATNSSGPRPGGTGAMTQASATVVTFLNTGDYVELRALQNSGGALNTAVGSAVSIVWIGS